MSVAGNSIKFFLVSLCCVMILCGSVFYSVTLPSVAISQQPAEPLAFRHVTAQFNVSFRHLAKMFGNQMDMTYKTVCATVFNAMQPTEPRDPACILVIGDQDSKLTTSCFAQKLAEIVHDAFRKLPTVRAGKPLLITGSQISKESGQGAIAEMRRIAEPINSRETYTLLVKDLELFPPETSDFFHTFCDNEAAPSKRLVMVVTINIPSIKNYYQVVNPDQLDVYGMWKKYLAQEKLKALDSRIGNSKIVLIPEAITSCK